MEKIKKEDLQGLHHQLLKLYNSGKANFPLMYCIKRNMDKIESELKKDKHFFEQLPGQKEFDDERMELCTKYAKKDEKGSPVFNGRNFIIENEVLFNEEIKNLETKYKDLFDKLKELLTLEADFEPYRFDKERIPDTLNDAYAIDILLKLGIID